MGPRPQKTIANSQAAGVMTNLAGTDGLNGFADVTGAAASFSGPASVALDQAGNLYVTDGGNATIRKITQAGVLTTLVGSHGVHGAVDGTGSPASFRFPSGVAVDKNGNVYVADSGNNLIRKIALAGVVTTGVGKAGSLGDALGPLPGSLYSLVAVAVDTSGVLYVISENGVLKIQLQ